MCHLEYGFICVVRPYAVAADRLVGEGHRFARQHTGVSTKTDNLIAEPPVTEFVEESVCGRDEFLWINRSRCLDRGREFWRAEICVDPPLDMSTDLKPEPQIALFDR